MPKESRLDPWGRDQIEDYGQLIRDFGIEPFGPLLARVPRPMRLMARSIIFGHRDYGRVLEAVAARRPFGVISGFMPSGRAHLGAKMVMEEIVWHQKMGGDATVAVADMEAHAVRNISWERCREWGIREYVLSLIALGLEPDRAKVYFQSENRQVQDLAFRLAKEANHSELKAIYGFSGETTLAHMLCPAVQAADILAPPLDEKLGGSRPLVVPVGVDQDPHIRLTRDLAARVSGFDVEERKGHIVVRPRRGDVDLRPGSYVERLNSLRGVKTKNYRSHVEVTGATFPQVEQIIGDHIRAHPELGHYQLVPPASLYHRFMSGLTGGKMSSSIPESHIALSEPPAEAEVKVLKAKTGGRATEREQREKGGEPEKCAVYELMQYNLGDDAWLEDMYKQCRAGTRLCGECKSRAAEQMKAILKDHQERREEAEGRLDEFGLKI